MWDEIFEKTILIFGWLFICIILSYIQIIIKLNFDNTILNIVTPIDNMEIYQENFPYNTTSKMSLDIES